MTRSHWQPQAEGHGGRRSRRATGLLVSALMAVLSTAVADPAAAAGDGSLTRLGGNAGCLSVADQPGCARARALGRPTGVTVSPTGGSVYVTSARSNAVAVFRRDALTGVLHQLGGRAGCVRNRGGRGCARGRALRGPSDVLVSPDGRNVYVASEGSGSIAVFRRNRTTGALRQLRGGRGCVRDTPGSACRNVRALAGASVLAIGSGGRFLYAATARGIAAFRRNLRTGALAQLGGSAGCVSAEAREGCAVAGTLVQVADLALRGDNLYASSPGQKAVTLFDLDAGAPVAADAFCISDGGEGGCASGRTLNGVFGLAVSPGGLQLYAVAEFNAAVAILARAQGGELSQPPGPAGCIRDGGGLDCAEARFMGHPDLIELSRDGRNAYVRAEAGALVVLSRNGSTGELSQLPGKKGCVADHIPSCGSNHGLSAGFLALSPDGRNVYVVSDSFRGAIAVYRRAA
jgi:DNA-binding beta-propeller fold protein YncE